MRSSSPQLFFKSKLVLPYPAWFGLGNVFSGTIFWPQLSRADTLEVKKKKRLKSTFESVLMRWMKLEPIIQSEVSQKEKNPIQYINAYIWNLERW